VKESIRFVRHDDKVLILINGVLTADLPWEIALKAGATLISLGKQIENDQNPEEIILDQAILMRAGVQLGLSDNVLIMRESFKEAQGNRDLRRYMPRAPGIESKAVVGTPTIRRGKPHV